MLKTDKNGKSDDVCLKILQRSQLRISVVALPSCGCVSTDKNITINPGAAHRKRCKFFWLWRLAHRKK